MSVATHMALLAYLPYSEESDAVEAAISKWISNPTNLQHFSTEHPIRWTATVAIMIEGEYRSGAASVRMVSTNPLMLAGETVEKGDAGRK